MPTKEELANEAKVNELRRLAAENDVDLEGATTKDEIVDKLTSSKKVTKDQIEALDSVGGDGSGDGTTEPAPGHAGPIGSPTGGAPNPAGSGGPRSLVVADEDAAASGTGLVTTDDVRQRVEGRTSDAASRQADVRPGDVEPDLTDGPKPSDGGDERYPFPPQGDVDVATIPDVSKKVAKAEYMEPLDSGDVWVRLSDHEDVPEELRGHVAMIVEAPTKLHPVDGVRIADPDQPVVVRTRDEHDARVQVPFDAIEAISRNGRAGLLNFA